MTAIAVAIVGLGIFALTACGAFVVLYAFLRLAGKLCVNSNGWHAGSVRCGRKVVVPALRLFALFQSAMRFEARVRSWGSNKGRERRDAVSEVVVELVSIG